MNISIKIAHSGKNSCINIADGKTVADALEKLGYPRQGHEFWVAWVEDVPISLSSRLKDGQSILIMHKSASKK